MSTKKTLIFIPTYNEKHNVQPICERVCALGLEADVVFMDDSSPDGTGDVLDGLAQKYEHVSVLHRPTKSGIGSAHIDGIAYAYRLGYQRLVTLDADFTHSPESIPAFLSHSHTADVVVGSRYLASDSLPGWSLLRKNVTKLAHVATKTMLRMSHDATGAFRVYNLETIPEGVFALVQSHGYGFFFESLFILHINRFTIAEVPIALPARAYGSSKMGPFDATKGILELGWLALARFINPSRFRFAGQMPEKG